MTLGRTASNAIKIKTDGGTTRAVECACCENCSCPDGGAWVAPIDGVFQITAASWGGVSGATLSDGCGNFSANAGGYSINFKWACGGYWFASIYNGGPIGDGNPCNLLSSFIFAASPVGTHSVADDYGCGSPSIYPDFDAENNTSALYENCAAESANCSDWSVTISDVTP